MLKRSFMALLCFISCSLSGNAWAQNNISAETLQQMEDSLVSVADSMYNAFLPDERPIYCEKFIKQLVRVLKTPNSYAYPFDKLKAHINIIGPDDKSFKIFNWVVVPAENTCRYYGAVQMPSENLKLYPLVDYTAELTKGAEDSILTSSKWFGALYYRIITNEVNGSKYYTLFGVNSGGAISNKKVLDPLSFTENGIVFGAPIFSINSETNNGQRINRFVMEYKKGVQASLNWDDDLKVIYFDKLVSQVNDPNRKYTYVPSGQYDGLRWGNDQWNYVQDLIPVQNFKDGEAPSPKPLKAKE